METSDHLVLVTGGCGFIGSNFIRLLLARRPRWRVVNLDKLTYAGNLENLADVEEVWGGTRYFFLLGDITDFGLVKSLLRGDHPKIASLGRPLTLAVNFAAESHVDRSIMDAVPFLRTNVDGVRVLLDALRSHPIQRFIQVSTDEVYGDAGEELSFSEESPLRPSSPYAASKAAADLLCLAYVRTYGVPLIITRSSNNYGPYQFPEKLIPLMIQNAIEGKPLPVYGDGGNIRDWVYVEDHCVALLSLLESGKAGDIYNISSGELRSNREVVESICRIVAERLRRSLKAVRQLVRFVEDRPGHDRRYTMVSEKIHSEIGWRPATSFQARLRDTVEWYLEHQSWVQRVTTREYRQYYEAVYERSWGTK
jgi:dTDP-glucose 4,6-dehydratase